MASGGVRSSGPDFSAVDSLAKAEALWREGLLERLFLMPPEFGGPDVPKNVVYVPIGLAAVKANIDINIIKPMVAEGKATRYTAVPRYQGNSFIPIAIDVTATDPGHFSGTIAVWGEALRGD
jgi:hypothetical protein